MPAGMSTTHLPIEIRLRICELHFSDITNPVTGKKYTQEEIGKTVNLEFPPGEGEEPRSISKSTVNKMLKQYEETHGECMASENSTEFKEWDEAHNVGSCQDCALLSEEEREKREQRRLARKAKTDRATEKKRAKRKSGQTGAAISKNSGGGRQRSSPIRKPRRSQPPTISKPALEEALSQVNDMGRNYESRTGSYVWPELGANNLQVQVADRFPSNGNGNRASLPQANTASGTGTGYNNYSPNSYPSYGDQCLVEQPSYNPEATIDPSLIMRNRASSNLQHFTNSNNIPPAVWNNNGGYLGPHHDSLALQQNATFAGSSDFSVPVNESMLTMDTPIDNGHGIYGAQAGILFDPSLDHNLELFPDMPAQPWQLQFDANGGEWTGNQEVTPATDLYTMGEFSRILEGDGDYSAEA